MSSYPGSGIPMTVAWNFSSQMSSADNPASYHLKQCLPDSPVAVANSRPSAFRSMPAKGHLHIAAVFITEYRGCLFAAETVRPNLPYFHQESNGTDSLKTSGGFRNLPARINLSSKTQVSTVNRRDPSRLCASPPTRQRKGPTPTSRPARNLFSNGKIEKALLHTCGAP